MPFEEVVDSIEEAVGRRATSKGPRRGLLASDDRMSFADDAAWIRQPARCLPPKRPEDDAFASDWRRCCEHSGYATKASFSPTLSACAAGPLHLDGTRSNRGRTTRPTGTRAERGRTRSPRSPDWNRDYQASEPWREEWRGRRRAGFFPCPSPLVPHPSLIQSHPGRFRGRRLCPRRTIRVLKTIRFLCFIARLAVRAMIASPMASVPGQRRPPSCGDLKIIVPDAVGEMLHLLCVAAAHGFGSFGRRRGRPCWSRMPRAPGRPPLSS